jgi:N-acetylmuramoyl-L-alanine amidase
MLTCARVAAALAILILVSPPEPGFAQAVKTAYETLVAREEVLRKDADQQPGLPTPLLHRMRAMVAEYEDLADRYPRSGYSDNALHRAAVLSADAFWQVGEESDRRAALRLFKALGQRFPKSSLNQQVAQHTARLEGAPLPAPAPAAPPAAIETKAVAAPEDRPTATLQAIRRDMLPEGLRVTLELEREAAFYEERLEGPPRVFIDLQNTRTQAELRDATLGFPDGLVRQIRVGRQQGGVTRVVLDLRETVRHSVYALYNPYRIVVDVERAGSTPAVVAAAAPTKAKEEPGASWTAPPAPTPAAVPTTGPSPAPAAEPRPPAAASTNRNGSFSLSRQLGLGISRVVIDAGHGGHDPGARVKGLNEADLTLDVAVRLEKLLLGVPGVEVVMTRRTDVFIPLEERTAIANRAEADLFLSIHVNASETSRARGIETYFLNFAPNPEAEAIAARENAGSAKTMHDLPDIVKAIALNNKIDESRDFATLVQNAMITRIKKAQPEVKNLGVKQAPFMVLIGATMPSVLAEISFITNRQEAALLKQQNYRQAIAEALFAGISKYQKSLKTAQTVASQ